MNLTQLKANGYKVFNRQRSDNKEANIVALQYIEGLAARTNTDIASWDLLEIFGGEGRREYDLLKDKNAINKIFFEREAQLRESVDENIQQIRAMVGARAREITEVNRQKRAANLEREYTLHMQQVENASATQKEYLKRAHSTYRAIQDLRGQATNMENEVVGVLRDKFWKFRDFTGANILYETVSDIILTEQNPAAGLDIRVNLGKFIAEVTLETCNLRIYPLCTLQPSAYSLKSGRFYHPHISDSGSVCWGSASAAATGHQSRGELTRLMTLLASLLSSYSAEAPYRALVHFHETQQQRERLANGQTSQVETGPTQSGVGGSVASGIAGIINETLGGAIASGTAAYRMAPNFFVQSAGTESHQAVHQALRDQLGRAQRDSTAIFARQVDGNWTITDEPVNPRPVDPFAILAARRPEDGPGETITITRINEDERFDWLADGGPGNEDSRIWDEDSDDGEEADEETEESAEASETSGEEGAENVRR